MGAEYIDAMGSISASPSGSWVYAIRYILGYILGLTVITIIYNIKYIKHLKNAAVESPSLYCSNAFSHI